MSDHLRSSDETATTEAELARAQGHAYGSAVLHMTTVIATGREVAMGDYLVSFAVQEAEGLYEYRGGALTWVEPEEENAHIEVMVRSVFDGRFLPGLSVSVRVEHGDGAVLGEYDHPFLWHPWLHHYGRNWVVAAAGEYTLRVSIAPPLHMPRHDRENGHRFIEPVTAVFTKVALPCGQRRNS